jgi:hypothetical protein
MIRIVTFILSACLMIRTMVIHAGVQMAAVVDQVRWVSNS